MSERTSERQDGSGGTEQTHPLSSKPSVDDTHHISVESLVKEEGVIPFLGFTSEDNQSASYPGTFTVVGERFDPDASSFVGVLDFLPKPADGTLLSRNMFAITDDNDDVVGVDAEAIRDIHGLDVDKLEDITEQSVEELAAVAADTHAEPYYEVQSNKEIIDPRRLALRTLFGIPCRYRYYVGSDGYEAGDMHALLTQKRAIDEDNAFGWLRFRNYGGEVSITTVYPSLSTEGILENLPSDVDIDLDDNTLVATADGDDDQDVEKLIEIETPGEDASDLADDSRLTAYFGEKTTYNYHGTSKIKTRPVVFIPQKKVTVPLPVTADEFSFSRKHSGDWMNAAHERQNDRLPPAKWHQKIVSKLEDLSEPISKELLRSRMVSVDFDTLPYSLTDFYTYLGLPQTYAEQAAGQAAQLSSADAVDSFSLWTLQVAVKSTLLDEFQGNEASSRYRDLEDIAGQLLRYPVRQLSIANDAYLREQEQQDDESDAEDGVLDPAQETLFESLDEIGELPGVTTDSLDLTEGQKVQNRLDETIQQMEECSS
jgi:hypothetical protein